MHPESYDTAYAQSETPERDGALLRLDEELKQLNIVVDELTKRLDPVLLHHPQGIEDNVKAMADSGFRQRIATLASTTARVERLIRDIDL